MNFQKQTLRPLFFLFLLTCLLSGLVGVARIPVSAAPISILISQVYGAGGNGGALYQNDYVELFNPTNSTISVTGWSIQYASATGTGWFSGDITPLSGSLAPGQYYLVQLAGGGIGSLLPVPDATGSTPMDATGGKVVLVNTTTGLACNGSSTPCTAAELASIVDLVGYGNANFYEGSAAAPAPSTTTSAAVRSGFGCTDADNNSTDFSAGSPTPRNTNSIGYICGVGPYTPTITPIPTIEVVINEVAWAGTRASSDDEWIELYNPSGTVTVDISDWRLVSASGSLDITFPVGTMINPGGYFLIERRQQAINVAHNLVTAYPWALNDNGDILRLRKPDGTIVDAANSNGGAWPTVSGALNFPSMVRTLVAPDSDFVWVTFDGPTLPSVTDAGGFLIYGTPGSANSQPGVTPTYTVTPSLTSTATATATFTATTTPTRTLTPTITSTALTPATNIVISEFRTIGPNGANDEFIELYNPTALPVSIGGWMIKRSSVCGTTVATIVNIPAAVTLASGQHYLIGGTTYSGTVIPDQANISLGIGDTGGLALLLADGVTIVDQVGLCASTLYREGTAITAIVANANQSWDRKSSLTGLCVDSNNNVQDFILRRPSDPQNFASPLTRCGNPTATPTITPPQTSAPKPTRTRTPLPPILPPPPPLIAINEFVPRPGHDWNNDGAIDVGDEYIELINHGVIDVNLSGYILDDEANIGSNPYRLPSVTLKPGERMVFYGKETGLLLSDGGDGVRLNKPNGQLGDAYNYTVVKFPDQSYCRLPDNGGDLDEFTQNCFPTPGLKNSLSGRFVRPPTQQGEDPPACPISDILPIAFAWAECPSFGNIWSRFYWDAKGWLGEMTIPDIDSKWDVYVD